LQGFSGKTPVQRSRKVQRTCCQHTRSPIFQCINWKKVEAGEARPPFFICRKGFRDMTRQKIKLEDLMNDMDKNGECYAPISEEEQKLFNGFSFISDEWRAMMKMK
ncbi:unnamed protein product, partial [Staurois parvus]